MTDPNIAAVLNALLEQRSRLEQIGRTLDELGKRLNAIDERLDDHAYSIALLE